MRNLKKYLSVLLVVAIIATTMVPVFAAETYSYSAEAQKLNTLGLYAGVSTTTFDPDLGTALDRETGIVMLLRIFGLEATAKAMSDADAAAALAAYTDAKDVSAWALKSVAYAVKNGLVAGTTGTTIGPKEALNGDMYATLVLRQLGYTVGPNDYANATYILADKGGLKITEAIKFDSKDLIKDDLVGITFAALNAKYTTGQTVIADLMADGVVTVTNAVYAGVYTAPATPTPTATPTPVPFGVESITALNNKQVQVVFNREVNSTDAKNKAFYNRASAALAAGDLVELQADNKTVIITLAAAEANQATIKYTVLKNLRDSSGTKLAADVNKDVLFLDTTVPTATKVEQNGPNGVLVYFSEPITTATAAGFKVDGGRYYATVGTMDAQRYTVAVTFGTNLTIGDHTIIINPTNNNDVKDATGLALREATFTFAMAADTTAPSIASAKATSRKAVELTFSEPLNAVPAATDVYHSSTGYLATGTSFKAGTNNTVVVVDFTGNPLPAGTATIYVAKEKVQDKFSNKNAAILSISTDVTDDTAKPTATGVTISADNKIVVNWSEAVTGSEIDTNYILKDSAGVAILNKAYSNASGNPIGTFVYNSTDKTTTITFAASLPAGSYQLSVSGVKDNALVPNVMDAQTFDMAITDTQKPTVTATADLIAATATEGQKIVVLFSESMNESILATANYVLNGAALPTGTTITAGVDNKSAIIQLPLATTITTAATLQVGQVADVVGNKTALIATPVGLTTAAAITTQQFKAISTKEITIETLYPLSSIDAAAFTVDVDGVGPGLAVPVVSAYFENKALPSDSTKSGAVITIAVADANKWTTDATPTVIIGANAAKDSMNRAIATTAGSPAADKTAPALAKVTVGTTDYNDIKVYDTNANGKIDTVVLTYTEAIKADTIATTTYDVAGYTINSATVGVAPANNVVTLALAEKSTVDTAIHPTIRQLSVIKDNLGTSSNSKAADADYIATLDATAPYIVSATVTTVAGAGNDIVTLTFSEPLKKATAENAIVLTNITIAGGNLAGATSQTLSDSGEILTIVTNRDFVTNNAFTVGYNVLGGILDNSTIGNAFATNATAATGFVTGAVADATAPTVLVALDADTDGGAAGNETIAAAATYTFKFSEKLDATSKTNVTTALTAKCTVGTLAYSWTDDATLVATATGVATFTIAGGNVTAAISDGTNTTAAAVLVNVANN